MALIKCPECDNKISDQADVCPKCGYELKSKPTSNFSAPKIKWNNKYLIVIVLLVVGGFLIFNKSKETNNNGTNNNQNNQPSQTDNNGTNYPSQTNSGYMVYMDSASGLSFEYPSNYKVAIGNDGFIYVAKNIDSEGAIIPFIVIGRYNNFNNPQQFLISFTDYMRSEYTDLVITIDLVSGIIGNRTVYGIAYNYTSSGHLVVDNRYAVTINNKVYMVGSKEENSNTAEINSVVEHILSTITEGGA